MKGLILFLQRMFSVDKIEVESGNPVNHHDPAAIAYWWRWKARNGQIVATSETYDNAGNARKAGQKAAKKLNCKYVDHTKA